MRTDPIQRSQSHAHPPRPRPPRSSEALWCRCRGAGRPVRRARAGSRRGGTFTIRVWDPPHFDPYLIVAFKTQIVYSFTHSRLLKHKAGPGVQPGSFALEGDLAESWSQPDDTTYVFKLRKGVRWHPKPPVNGRELTAEDVVYSLERFRTVKGNPQNYLL